MHKQQMSCLLSVALLPKIYLIASQDIVFLNKQQLRMEQLLVSILQVDQQILDEIVLQRLVFMSRYTLLHKKLLVVNNYLLVQSDLTHLIIYSRVRSLSNDFLLYRRQVIGYCDVHS